MRRREFITLVGGAAAWPIGALAQQPDEFRRIGVRVHTAADDPEGQTSIAAFKQALQQLGWTEGRNLRIDYRWAAGNAEQSKRRQRNLLRGNPM